MKVKEIMKKSGIPMHLKGYEVLTMCIESHVKNPEKTMSELYAEVYDASKCKFWSVERNIRTALRIGYPNMDSELKKTLFQNSASEPSAGEFIKAVSCAIRNDLI